MICELLDNDLHLLSTWWNGKSEDTPSLRYFDSTTYESSSKVLNKYFIIKVLARINKFKCDLTCTYIRARLNFVLLYPKTRAAKA